MTATTLAVLLLAGIMALAFAALAVVLILSARDRDRFEEDELERELQSILDAEQSGDR